MLIHCKSLTKVKQSNKGTPTLPSKYNLKLWILHLNDVTYQNPKDHSVFFWLGSDNVPFCKLLYLTLNKAYTASLVYIYQIAFLQAKRVHSLALSGQVVHYHSTREYSS